MKWAHKALFVAMIDSLVLKKTFQQQTNDVRQLKPLSYQKKMVRYQFTYTIQVTF